MVTTTEGPPPRPFRLTLPTCLVLQIFLKQPEEEIYGLQITRELELQSGTVHPILTRLEQAGWVESRWEDVDPRYEGRPRRRYYRLSSDGAVQAPRAITRMVSKRGPLSYVLRPGLNGGAST
ncbi:PadR family transcriptional regulator [Streptomyces sp. NPDC057757]|uniref:PadR family transcriptional regulator n=1 Tax=Streptomyces sp. NPDC057757 TaxID=3346241 RepID=UPI00367F179F